MAIPMDRYATFGGEVRTSTVEAEQIAAAIEASIRDRSGRDGYSSDFGTSSAGAGPSRSREISGQSTNAESSKTPAIPQPLVAPPLADPYLVQAYPLPTSSRPRRPSQPDLPNVLDTALSQAQQFASQASPSRRHRIVPGAVNNDRIYVPPENNRHWSQVGSQTTYANGYATIPSLPVSAPVEDSSRKHRRRHKSRTRTHRGEENSMREADEREDIAGVIGLGLIDESLEERRQAAAQNAFYNGYTEGLNSGFNARAGPTPGPPTSAPVSQSVMLNGLTETDANTIQNSRQEVPRRNTTQSTTRNVMTPESLANRLRDLMEDPIRSAPAPLTDRRSSAVSSETLTWGTVTTTNSSRRQSDASDVMAHLRGLPEHGIPHSRTSLASSQEIPVGDPRAFLPVVPPSASVPSQIPAMQTNGHLTNNPVPILAAPSPIRPIIHSDVHYSSQTPTATNVRPDTRGSVRHTNQPMSGRASTASTARPASLRYNSLPANNASTSTTNGDRSHRHSHRHTRDHRPQPLPISNQSSSSSSNSASNPIPTPFGYPAPPPPTLNSAPPRPVFYETTSAPAVPVMPMTPAVPNPNGRTPNRTSHASHTSHTPHHHNVSTTNFHPRTPGADANALGLDMNDDSQDEYDEGHGYGHEPIPAFAAPTPRASHNMFLRSFSFDGFSGDEVDGSLYR
ncbi:hypothetical protein F5878DRAFT_5413 [Lentinula raphanica]|uniref:Uncharacterized protein n=1 Tax=Lentinula raphanica TaxID=153919 RepID=A0AA38PET1_9AGAR|nr:hypothetical protein F5878DRAFT_5413 [Lentinula raphanica]